MPSARTPPSRFGYLDAPHRLRTIRARQQSVANLGASACSGRPAIAGRHRIDTDATLIRSDSFQCLLQDLFFLDQLLG
jgi:hypothetical protein